MALPSVVKTWRFQVNNTIAGNANLLTQNQNLLFALHTAIIGSGSYTDKDGAALAATNAATVVASCDSSTFSMAGVNKWLSASNLVWTNSGASGRSWIVYHFAAAGVYLCLECFDGGLNTYRLTAKVSHLNFSAAAGGTDGTLLAAPTALDAITLVSGDWGGASALNTASVLHVMAAQDGTAFNAVICRSSYAPMLLHIGKPLNARAGWTYPVAVFWYGISTAAPTNDVTQLSVVCQTAPAIKGFANSGATITLMPATTGVGSNLFPALFAGADAFSGDYPIFEHLWACNTGGSQSAYLGIPPDLWFGTTGHTTGAAYPGAGVDAAHPRQFAKFGPWVYPWNNSLVVAA